MSRTLVELKEFLKTKRKKGKKQATRGERFTGAGKKETEGKKWESFRQKEEISGVFGKSREKNLKIEGGFGERGKEREAF